MEKKLTDKEAVELIKKYTEEMPSKIASDVLNTMAVNVFGWCAEGFTVAELDYCKIIDRQAENPSETFGAEDEEDKAVTNHPKRYLNKSGIEAIDIIELFANKMEDGAKAFNFGTAVKYLSRLGKKTSNVKEEWKKVKWYMDRYNSL